ncbi:uncharacterized protein LOC100162126 [Acyrthosiphon pisum]|uniref:Uncharacterized protein n=1 Tax=Acyrthosiphon pisum TaxID=7029 RepID=A0A8R2NRL3_ACYPI|nr:uncharacterized protein LOC100162126 [Acyrthosiphon pisum]|eukprot:XP_001950492.1 PREDICTED: uncharacterized protein LOC100162126 [Acyrthosiphon pisum]
MNSIGAMNSPVKQPLPTVLAPPTISNSSPSKVQQPPNLTPLNLNTSQSAQPLSLVNEHKNIPIVIPSPIMTSVENIVPKSTACNGIPDTKAIGEKIEEALPKIESQLLHNQVNNSVNVKIANESPLSEVKPQISEVENLSQKKDDKNNLPIVQTDKVVLPEVIVTSISDPIKPEELRKTENLVSKPKEHDAKISQDSPEIKTAAETNQGPTVSSEKAEQALVNTSKVSVRRKREHKQLEEEDDKKEKSLKKDTPVEEIKSKRTRLPTQPFQLSLLPEMHHISKISEKPVSSKINSDKLTVFYKNEFLAVRNEDGGFYLCQAMQNIHRASRRIRIRWLTQHPNDEFTPDFYDHTEFDCILTNITLKKIQKEQWKLPEKEKLRIENILKRSIDVEKGSEKPSVTEEHPDGLDVSLFKDEAQLTKKKGSKKSITLKRKVSTDEQPVKKSSRLSKKKPSYDFGHSSSESDENDDEEDNSNQNRSSNKKVLKKKVIAKEPAKKIIGNMSKPKQPSVRKTQTPVKPTYVLASVSSAVKKREIIATKQKKENNVDKKSSKKVEPKSPAVPLPSERSSKTRNAGNAVSAKITTAGIGIVKNNPNDRKTLRNRK